MKKIFLQSKVLVDNYTEYVCDKYDLQTREEIITEVPLLDTSELSDFKWNIGVLCGNSGSGKSTLLSTLGEPKNPIYDYSKSIISQFPHMSEHDVCELLSSVGLSSVPIWLHKPNELSNGERARLDLCWILANAKENEIILYDEFSSVINRAVAKSMSYALQRYVREKNLKIILASCHFDIIEWLNPDWVFNLNKQTNGECEIERFIYKDDEEYQLYNNINKKDILTDEYTV
jgi:ABC-type lipoprotein export system ATPase subunit